MIQSSVQGLGFPSLTSIAKTALNPIAATKASINATKTVAKPVAKTVYKASVVPLKATATVAKTTGKVIYQAHAIPTKWLALKPTEWLADKALSPVKSRVRTLVSRRAAKLAMDNRKSTTPTPAEVAEARKWVKHKLTYDGPAGIPTPHGKILALFAGSVGYSDSGFGGAYYDGQLGIAPAVAAAAVPILIALANAMIAKYAKSGEAPANPQADVQAAAMEPPAAPGTQDLQPVQDAVAEAAASAAIDAGADPVEAAASGQVGPRRPFAGISKNHMLIGGAVLGGVVLLALLTKKS